MSTKLEENMKKPPWLGIGAVLAAIGASACCIGPLVLLSLGIGGAWMSTLTSMQSVRPLFLILTLVFIALGFRKLYLIPGNCETGKACSSEPVRRNQRVIFWIGTVFLIGLLTFPWYAPIFLA